MYSNSQLVGKFLLDQKKKIFHESTNNTPKRNSNNKHINFTEIVKNKQNYLSVEKQGFEYFKNSESLKLDVGDYAVGGDLYDYTFVDRKSYQDFCATITNGYARFAKELERCRSMGCMLFVVIETAFDKMWATNRAGYKKFNLDYVYHRMREIQAEYSDCCQFVFSGSRRNSEEIIPKILGLGKKLWTVDVQYFWGKQLKEDGLENRNTKTTQRVQRYKSVDSKQRGVFGGN